MHHGSHSVPLVDIQLSVEDHHDSVEPNVSVFLPCIKLLKCNEQMLVLHLIQFYFFFLFDLVPVATLFFDCEA